MRIKEFGMNILEQCALESKKRDHDVISAAINDFGRIGYMIESIARRGGALEIVCYPPRRKGGKEESPPCLSMDGVSETFRP
jgi:hypothetical protein